MPGFCIFSAERWSNNINILGESFQNDFATCGRFKLFRNTIKKFEDDKIFETTSEYILVLDGCLLNKKQLLEKYKCSSITDLMLCMYCEGANKSFFKEFRGPFTGALYDIKEDLWIVFTNQTGEKTVFYYQYNDVYIISSQLDWIYAICRDNRLPLTLDENGIYQSITFGFMEDDSTYAHEVKRLRGGKYLEIRDGIINVIPYFTFTKNPKRYESKTEDEIIDIIDEKFRNAVKLEFDKDLEYGYDHLADMSGGLDSRMNVWVAHSMGYNNFQLLTYCKSNYQDEMISKQIARYWKDSLFVRPLDDLHFFYDIDTIVQMNGGTSAYIGITGGKRLLEALNWEKFGIEHNGLIGDVVIGSFLHSMDEIDSRIFTGRYSEKLAAHVDSSEYYKEFVDHEIYLMYTRGFQGACNTVSIRNYYTESCSPFMNVDFLQTCMDIPLKLRINHNIYKKWILKKYKEAAAFPWETINGLITESNLKLFVRKALKRGPKALLRRVGILKNSSDNGMNPLDFWIETNPKVSDYLSKYVEIAENKLSDLLSNDIKKDMKYLYTSGTAIEKCMVATAYSALLLMFDL